MNLEKIEKWHPHHEATDANSLKLRASSNTGRTAESMREQKICPWARYEKVQ